MRIQSSTKLELCTKAFCRRYRKHYFHYNVTLIGSLNAFPPNSEYHPSATLDDLRQTAKKKSASNSVWKVDIRNGNEQNNNNSEAAADATAKFMMNKLLVRNRRSPNPACWMAHGASENIHLQTWRSQAIQLNISSSKLRRRNRLSLAYKGRCALIRVPTS